jgi:hypothetical protein
VDLIGVLRVVEKALLLQSEAAQVSHGGLLLRILCH